MQRSTQCGSPRGALFYLVILMISQKAACGQEVPGFLPPVLGLFAEGADLYPVQSNQTLQGCATWCTSEPSCISFNFCSESECGIQSWSPSYNPGTSPSCAWYRRILPRNDTPIAQAVPWVLGIPAPGTVALTGGPMYGAFEGNIQDFIKLRDPMDMLYWYAARSGDPAPEGKCYGWGGWIKGSETGNYLMGAGSTLQWREDVELRAGVASVIAGIRKYQDMATGWLWAFNESDLFNAQDNYPDYATAWVVRGLLDSYRAGGLPDALQIARDSLSQFNNHTSLPWFLPQNGGPSPVLPYPPQFDNTTFGGYGQPAGHTIYIEYQGQVRSTLMALSPLGTQEDVDIVEGLYVEQWWLEALLAKDLYHGIWHRQFFAHNYEVTAFEAFLDLYVLTGNTTYLRAVQNAWDMLMDHWILPGGSFALNEGAYYPPDSYYIGFTDIPSPAFRGGLHTHHTHTHDPAPLVSTSDPYFHSPCIFRDEAGQEGMAPSAPATPPGAPSSDPPTGELCGSVFWTLLNQRFHRLFPDNETFVGQMERSILNVGVAALGREGSGGEGPGGRGIRYFANQHKVKQTPTMRATCCEGQGTRLFGSLPSFLFTLEESPTSTTVRVDLYAQSSLTSIPLPPSTVGGGSGGLVQQQQQQHASLSVITQWPYGSSVTINLTLTSPIPAGALRLGFRMPHWLPGPVSVGVVGGGVVGVGQPGSFFFPPTPPTTSTLYTFDLPMALKASPYVGATQIPPYKRYSFLLGPVLLAMQGPWDAASDSLVMPAIPGGGLDPMNPTAWLVPGGDGNPLHFNVTGAPGYTMKPYWEVQEEGELFSNYPCFH